MGMVAQQVESKEIQSITAMMEEIAHKLPECSNYLEKHNIDVIPIGDPITQNAFEIMRSLGLKDAISHPKGVDENDIFLIATGAVTNNAVISNEAEQPKIPDEIKKYKIPLVCKQQRPRVQCYSFIDYIKQHWKSV